MAARVDERIIADAIKGYVSHSGFPAVVEITSDAPPEGPKLAFRIVFKQSKFADSNRRPSGPELLEHRPRGGVYGRLRSRESLPAGVRLENSFNFRRKSASGVTSGPEVAEILFVLPLENRNFRARNA